MRSTSNSAYLPTLRTAKSNSRDTIHIPDVSGDACLLPIKSLRRPLGVCLINLLLADEILLEIFYEVGADSPVDLARAASTCVRWASIIRDDMLWRSVCKKMGFTHLRPWRDVVAENDGLLVKRRVIRSSSSSSLRVGTSMGLGVWRKMYRQNYLTKVNWKRGRCTVSSVNSFAGIRGHLAMDFDENCAVSVALGEDGRVWDLKTGLCKTRLSGHQGIISAVKFDDTHVISGGIDRTVRVWDARTGLCRMTLLGHEGEIVAVQYNSNVVVSASEDHTIRLWRLSDGAEINTLRGHEGPVCCLQLDSRRIASGSTDSTIKIWSIATGRCLRTLRGHNSNVYCVQMMGDKIVSGSEDMTIKIWRLAAGEVRTLTGHSSGVICIKADDSKIVSGSSDKTCKVWCMRTGQCMYTLSQHTGAVWNLTFTASKLITSSFDQSLLVWDFTFGDDVVDERVPDGDHDE